MYQGGLNIQREWSSIKTNKQTRINVLSQLLPEGFILRMRGDCSKEHGSRSNPASKHSSALASCTLFCRKTQVTDTHTYQSLVSHSSDATAKDMETSAGKGMDAALERSKMSAAVYCTCFCSFTTL